MKNCPGCGRFMALAIPDIGSPDFGTLEEGYIYFWCCGNEDCLQKESPIPAPKYDWRYCGISDEEITELWAEDPIAAQAFENMRTAIPVVRPKYKGDEKGIS